MFLIINMSATEVNTQQQQRSYRSNTTTNEWLQAMTSPPFTSDKAEDLYTLILDQFEQLNEDVNPLI